MANVAAVIKVFPESMEVFDSIRGAIEKGFKPYSIQEEELAFGMKALKVTFLMDDSKGSGDIEEKLKTIKGVSEVQTEEVTRV